ncbi:MAG: prepilin-type N-terminal cleavage/methylation domain-containing protein [Elusimicrobiaceae bacterium]|nr:prepilin-type N-terminal cleavage/methylation domain-containing protein [Elusimicrobiaceae bacterium]
MKLNYKAFTLIELLIVVLIIGILIAVALPQYQIAVAKARYATLKHMVKSLSDAQEIYYLTNGKYTENLEELDIDSGGTTDPTLKWHKVLDWGDCYASHSSARCNHKESSAYPQKYYIHSANLNWKGRWVCVARSGDLNNIQNKICKQETGLSAPTMQNGTYNEWLYD